VISGVPWDEARRLASPLEHVSSSCKPMLLFHSDDDPSIPIDQAERMNDALTKNKVYHRFLHYQDRGHIGLTNDFVIEESLKFIDEVEQEL
jgi:dipeptidyl aminopeptidase/acylaminoacyl peptidase